MSDAAMRKARDEWAARSYQGHVPAAARNAFEAGFAAARGADEGVYHKDGPLAQVLQMADWVDGEAAKRIGDNETLCKVSANLRSAADALARGADEGERERPVIRKAAQAFAAFCRDKARREDGPRFTDYWQTKADEIEAALAAADSRTVESVAVGSSEANQHFQKRVDAAIERNRETLDLLAANDGADEGPSAYNSRAACPECGSHERDFDTDECLDCRAHEHPLAGADEGERSMTDEEYQAEQAAMVDSLYSVPPDEGESDRDYDAPEGADEGERGASACCGADVRIGGGSGPTRYYVCESCEKACGLAAASPVPEECDDTLCGREKGHSGLHEWPGPLAAASPVPAAPVSDAKVEAQASLDLCRSAFMTINALMTTAEGDNIPRGSMMNAREIVRSELKRLAARAVSGEDR